MREPNTLNKYATCTQCLYLFFLLDLCFFIITPIRPPQIFFFSSILLCFIPIAVWGGSCTFLLLFCNHFITHKNRKITRMRLQSDKQPKITHVCRAVCTLNAHITIFHLSSALRDSTLKKIFLTLLPSNTPPRHGFLLLSVISSRSLSPFQDMKVILSLSGNS